MEEVDCDKMHTNVKDDDIKDNGVEPKRGVEESDTHANRAARRPMLYLAHPPPFLYPKRSRTLKMPH